MKRMLLTLAVLGLSGVSSRADWGGFQPPVPQQGNPYAAQAGYQANTLIGLAQGAPGHVPDRYGMMPGLRRVFRIGGEGCSTCNVPGKAGLFSKFGGGSTCATCGDGRGGHPWGQSHGNGGSGYDYPQYPPVMQGTLVFPNHQYMRSPRDYFMYEPGR